MISPMVSNQIDVHRMNTIRTLSTGVHFFIVYQLFLLSSIHDTYFLFQLFTFSFSHWVGKTKKVTN